MEVNGGKVVYEVGTDDTQLEKGLEGSMGKIKSFAMKAVALLGIGAILKSGSEYVINMQEDFEALERQVGSSAEKIEEWSKDAIDNLGLTQAEAIKTANTFSGMFVNMAKGDQGQATDMLMNFQERIADLSETFHVEGSELTDVFQGLFATGRAMNPIFAQMGIDLSDTAMQTMLARGELESYGLSMNDTWTQVDASTQAMVRYNELMQATSKYTGTFKEQAGSAEQNLAKLKAQFTQMKGALAGVLLPAFNAILPILQVFANFIEKNTGLVYGLIAAIGAFKVVGMIAKIAALIPELIAMAVAKTAAESGIAAPLTIAATLAAIGTGLAVAGVMYAKGSSSMSTASAGTKSETGAKIEVNVNVDPITGRATSNSNSSNIQTNVGRGGE